MNLNSVLLIGYLLLGIFNISSIRERVVIKQENKELLTNDNSVFVLKDTINLYGDTVLLGKNSQLKFRGGCLKNGTIIGDNNRITGLKKVVFSDIHFKGSFVVKKVSYKNFGYYRSYISEYNTEKVGLLKWNQIEHIECGKSQFLIIKVNDSDHVFVIIQTFRTRLLREITLRY